MEEALEPGQRARAAQPCEVHPASSASPSTSRRAHFADGRMPPLDQLQTTTSCCVCETDQSTTANDKSLSEIHHRVLSPKLLLQPPLEPLQSPLESRMAPEHTQLPAPPSPGAEAVQEQLLTVAEPVAPSQYFGHHKAQARHVSNLGPAPAPGSPQIIHALERAATAAAIAKQHTVKKQLLQAKHMTAQQLAAAASKGKSFVAASSSSTSHANSSSPLSKSSPGPVLGQQQQPEPKLQPAPTPSLTVSALTTASTSPSGSASPPREQDKEALLPMPPLPRPPPPSSAQTSVGHLGQSGSVPTMLRTPTTIPHLCLSATRTSACSLSGPSSNFSPYGAASHGVSSRNMGQHLVDPRAVAGCSLPQSPLVVPGFSRGRPTSEQGLGKALALMQRDLERRPGCTASETARTYHMLRDAAERRRRFERLPDESRERAEAAEAAAKALAQQVEDSRQARLEAHREAQRARMRQKVGARDQAKAQELLLSLRKTVRLELRRALAATRLQAQARRLAARNRVVRIREVRTQGRLCATQAAWRARTLLDCNARGAQAPGCLDDSYREVPSRIYGVIPESERELEHCEQATSSVGPLQLEPDLSVGRFEWTVVGLPYLK